MKSLRNIKEKKISPERNKGCVRETGVVFSGCIRKNKGS